MEEFSSLFKKQHMGELLLSILFIIYLIMGYKTPEPVANAVDTMVGKIVILMLVVYLFMHSNTILAVLSLFVAFDLIRRSSAATGIDAMVHAIEAFTTKRLKNPVSDCLAKEALRLLAANLHKAVNSGSDIVARENMLLGACLAGMAFTNAPVAGVHALAYPIGARFHVPHGLSNSLMLGPVMRFNLDAAHAMYAELGNIIKPGLQGSTKEQAAQLSDYLGGLAGELGLPQRLLEVGITANDINQLASDAMLQTRLLQNSPREITLADAAALYREAL